MPLSRSLWLLRGAYPGKGQEWDRTAAGMPRAGDEGTRPTVVAGEKWAGAVYPEYSMVRTECGRHNSWKTPGFVARKILVDKREFYSEMETRREQVWGTEELWGTGLVSI